MMKLTATSPRRKHYTMVDAKSGRVASGFHYVDGPKENENVISATSPRRTRPASPRLPAAFLSVREISSRFMMEWNDGWEACQATHAGYEELEESCSAAFLALLRRLEASHPHYSELFATIWKKWHQLSRAKADQRVRNEMEGWRKEKEKALLGLSTLEKHRSILIDEELRELRAQMEVLKAELEHKTASIRRLNEMLDKEILAGHSSKARSKSMAENVGLQADIRVLNKDLERRTRQVQLLEVEVSGLKSEVERLSDSVTYANHEEARIRRRNVYLEKREVNRRLGTTDQFTQTSTTSTSYHHPLLAHTSTVGDADAGYGGGGGMLGQLGPRGLTFLAHVNGHNSSVCVPHGFVPLIKSFELYKESDPIKTMDALTLAKAIDRIYTSHMASIIEQGISTPAHPRQTPFPVFVYRFYLQRHHTRRYAESALINVFASLDSHMLSTNEHRRAHFKTFSWFCSWADNDTGNSPGGMSRALAFFLRTRQALATLGEGPGGEAVSTNGQGIAWMCLGSVSQLIDRIVTNWHETTRTECLTTLRTKARRGAEEKETAGQHKTEHETDDVGPIFLELDVALDVLVNAFLTEDMLMDQELAEQLAMFFQEKDKDDKEKQKETRSSNTNTSTSASVSVTKDQNEGEDGEDGVYDVMVERRVLRSLSVATLSQIELLSALPSQQLDEILLELSQTADRREMTIRDLVSVIRSRGLYPVRCSWHHLSFPSATPAAAAAAWKLSRQRPDAALHRSKSTSDATVAGNLSAKVDSGDAVPDLVALAIEQMTQKQEAIERKWNAYVSTLQQQHKAQLDRLSHTKHLESQSTLQRQMAAQSSLASQNEALRVQAEAAEAKLADLRLIAHQEMAKLDQLRSLDVQMLDERLRDLQDAYKEETADLKAQITSLVEECRLKDETIACQQSSREQLERWELARQVRAVEATAAQQQARHRKLRERQAMLAEDNRARLSFDARALYIREILAENAVLKRMTGTSAATVWDHAQSPHVAAQPLVQRKDHVPSDKDLLFTLESKVIRLESERNTLNKEHKNQRRKNSILAIIQ